MTDGMKVQMHISTERTGSRMQSPNSGYIGKMVPYFNCNWAVWPIKYVSLPGVLLTKHA